MEQFANRWFEWANEHVEGFQSHHPFTAAVVRRPDQEAVRVRVDEATLGGLMDYLRNEGRILRFEHEPAWNALEVLLDNALADGRGEGGVLELQGGVWIGFYPPGTHDEPTFTEGEAFYWSNDRPDRS